MALTKETVKTYRDALLNDRERALLHLNAVNGGLEVANRFLRFLELEETGEVENALEVLGVVQK